MRRRRSHNRAKDDQLLERWREQQFAPGYYSVAACRGKGGAAPVVNPLALTADVAIILSNSMAGRFGSNMRYDFFTTAYYRIQWGYTGNITNNPDTTVPSFAQYSGGNAATYLIGPSTETISQIDNLAINPSNITTTTALSSKTFVNSFYQNAAYAATLVRAFDSYTSTDGGVTWAAPAGGATPQLPPSSYTTTPGGDVPLFINGSTSNYAKTVTDAIPSGWVSGGVAPLWELDGYSAFVNGSLDTSGTGGVPAVWTATDYSANPFHGWTQGPGYYGITFFLWPPDPRNATATAHGSTPGLGTVQQWLALLGMSNTTDQNTVNTNWSTWTLAQLQSWLTGGTTAGGPYTIASGPYVPGSSSKAPIYHAVCRLYNRAYPAGTSNPAFVADWRQRFFGTTSNKSASGDTGLFYSLSPTNTYSLNVDAMTAALGSSGLTVNYSAIVQWVKNTNSSGTTLTWTPSSLTPPNPFPTQLRSNSGIKYYGSIPTTIPSPVTTSNYPSFGGTDARFWKETIDYMLGMFQDTWTHYTDLAGVYNTGQDPVDGGGTEGNLYTGTAGYQEDFAWGTAVANVIPAAPRYMNYADNPARPLCRYWMGPLMLADYLSNCNISENNSVNGGTYSLMDGADAYTAPLYARTQAVLSLTTALQSYPNVNFTLISVNSLLLSNGAPNPGNNAVIAPLGQNYAYAKNALIYPYACVNADGSLNQTEVTPYDADPTTGIIPSVDFNAINRASGSRSWAFSLMQAYNQFITTPSNDTTLRTFTKSTPIAFPTGMAGGLGRASTRKIIIFIADHGPNYPSGDKGSSTYATSPSGTGALGWTPLKYYKIRYDMNNPASSEYPVNSAGVQTTNASNVVNQITAIIQQMGGTGNNGKGGDFGTNLNPFRVYCIGVGPMYNLASGEASANRAVLSSMQSASGATFAPQYVDGTDTQITAGVYNAVLAALAAAANGQ